MQNKWNILMRIQHYKCFWSAVFISWKTLPFINKQATCIVLARHRLSVHFWEQIKWLLPSAIASRTVCQIMAAKCKVKKEKIKGWDGRGISFLLTEWSCFSPNKNEMWEQDAHPMAKVTCPGWRTKLSSVTLIISLPYHYSFFHTDKSEVFCQYFLDKPLWDKALTLELRSLDGEKTILVALQTVCKWEKWHRKWEICFRSKAVLRASSPLIS